MPDSNDLKTRMQFDRFMTSARLYLRRGEMAKAGEAVVGALELRPNDLDARELAADLVLASGDLEKAAARYKELFSPEHPRPTAEEKYARTILQIAEEKYQKEMLLQMVNSPRQFTVGGKSPVLAAIASIGPGFGQIYLGKLVRGVVLAAVTIACWLLFYLLKPDVSSFPEDQRLSAFLRELTVGPVVFLIIAVFTHVYAFIDAVITSGKKPGPSVPEMPLVNEKPNTPGPQ